jgi:hypothetical protein
LAALMKGSLNAPGALDPLARMSEMRHLPVFPLLRPNGASCLKSTG